MSFNSLLFAVFLPVAFGLYWFVFGRNYKWQNVFVVVASYIFYGWWNWRFLSLIAFTSFCSWGSGLLIARFRLKGKNPCWISAANIVLNLGILCLFKYYDFFAQSFADLFLGGKTDGVLLHLVLPVGISFYTFQALSYSIYVYRGKIEATRDIVQFFAFVSFFPQLVAGPIERSTNLLPQFGRARKFEYAQAVDGFRQILWGYFKKVVVADSCAVYVNAVFGDIHAYGGGWLAAAAILFAFQVYGDFSGYADIAIGTAKLFGIKLTQNFATPFFSRTTSEFWQRWHITLMTWFRDYVYIPLGGSHKSKARTIANVLIVFTLSGLWHGADWNKVGWGVYCGLLMIPGVLSSRPRRKLTGVVAEGKTLPTWAELWQMVATFSLIVLGLIIFRTESPAQTVACFSNLFKTSTDSFAALLIRPKLFAASIWIPVLLTVEWIGRTEPHALTMKRVKSRQVRFFVYALLSGLMVLYFDNGAPAFFYFQF